MDRRSFVIGAAASAVTLAAAPLRAQEAYPSQAITLISPFPPGGVNDSITPPARRRVTRRQQPVVLENKPVAAVAVRRAIVASAKPRLYAA